MVINNNYTNSHTHSLLINLSSLSNKLKNLGHSISFVDSFVTDHIATPNQKLISHSLSLSHIGPTILILNRIVSTNIKHFINRKMGLSTDTKPSPFLLGDLLFYETDTGSLFLSDGVSNNLTQGPTKPESYISKKIDAESNTIIATTDYKDMNPFLPNLVFGKKGGVIPAATVQDSFWGVLDPNGIVLHSPSSVISTPFEGMELEFKNINTDSKLGFSTPVPVARRGESYELKLEVKSSSINQITKMLVGFSTSNQFSNTNVLDNSDSGVVIGFTPDENVFTVYHNDGTGVLVKDSFSVIKDQVLRTIEIKMSSTNIVCKLDNEVITLTAKIPSLTDDLYLLVYGIY